MTEQQKKPEPRQWWFSEDMSDRVYFPGVDSHGDLICETRYGFMWLADWDENTWHHEPDCTDWDWQPPDWVVQDRVPARPGIDQRRWTVDGKVINSLNNWGDCKDTVITHGDQAVHGYVWSGITLELRCLREHLPECPRVVEVWPKFFETDDPASIAYVRLDKSGPPVVVRKNGSETAACYPRELLLEHREQLTESEALARIKPAEPVPAPVEPLKIFAFSNGVLYCDTHPRQATHHEVDFGCDVRISLREVGRG